MTDQERIDTILAACEQARQQGHKICSGAWGIRIILGAFQAKPQCCPLGALIQGRPVTGRDPSAKTNEAADLLQVDTDWICGFVLGFDNLRSIGTWRQSQRNGRLEGQKVRARLWPVLYK